MPNKQQTTEDAPGLKPGDADYDWSKHYGDTEVFTFSLPNDKVIALKAFESLYKKTWLYQLRKLRTNDELIFAALDRGSCPEARRLLDALDPDADGDPVADLWKAWSTAGTSHDGDSDGEGLSAGN